MALKLSMGCGNMDPCLHNIIVIYTLQHQPIGKKYQN
jgi:hypothetical protein